MPRVATRLFASRRGDGPRTIAGMPDGGVRELEGLVGGMKIIIAEGDAHSYEFTWDIVKR